MNLLSCFPPTRRPAILCLLLAAIAAMNAPAAEPRQYYEVRTYHLTAEADAKQVDQYLGEALLPALRRAGTGPVGIFFDPQAEGDQRKRFVVIPYDQPDQFAGLAARLAEDEAYQQAAAAYHARPADRPLVKRISSELLEAFECQPQLAVPDQVATGQKRVYELRVYESATEALGLRKVDMFNNGEVPIFLDCGIRPVFFGRALLGPQRPNLTYLTVYADDDARNAAWDAFRKHPDWQVLKAKPEYANTVSHIDRHVLRATDDSQL